MTFKVLKNDPKLDSMLFAVKDKDNLQPSNRPHLLKFQNAQPAMLLN